ncbi:cyclophilin-like fold protein [Desulfovibrio oxyclinae]|uniref:cyclophilin-like fold protein n=1 Tax=Desulfovibrio oxyclinae TaxID=63560 RepID=UPI00037807BC|nr:cyclophilin-like fold protein [Desulfovibrio oxyclinae]
MNRVMIWLFFALILSGFMHFLPLNAVAGESTATEGRQHGLSFSDMKVEISSHGKRATFRLYDTVAAEEFHEQLPLELELSNFRDAQWMFYPPEKLNVKPEEAYHDGRKGELSYYEPWGDVFMLYRDFHAGDEMHRLGVVLSGVEEIAAMSGKAVIRQVQSSSSEKENVMRIAVTAGGKTVIYELNDSQAAKELYGQLPLNIAVEDYGSNEKIFYPPQKLSTSNTPLAENVRKGTLAYYAPWGDVVLFHDDFRSAPGLYGLGHAVEGAEHIGSLSGQIRVTPDSSQ